MTIQKTLALVLISGAALTTTAHSKFYVGADVGYSRTNAKQKGSVKIEGTSVSANLTKIAPKGFDTALRLGFMKNVNSFLWGFETSLGYAAGSNSKNSEVNRDGGTLNLKYKLRRGFTTDVIAKLGGKFNKTSVYGLGGVAFTQFKGDLNVKLQIPGTTYQPVSRKNSRMLAGLTFGAGIMQDITDKVAIKAEYRRTQYTGMNETVTYTNGTKINVKIKPATDAFMTGVVYNF